MTYSRSTVQIPVVNLLLYVEHLISIFRTTFLFLELIDSIFRTTNFYSNS